MHALADVAQQLVARAISERVVYLSESVEVDEQHSDVVGARGIARAACDALMEQRAVGQSGQLVVASEFVVLLGLRDQPPRGLRDDAEQERP